MEALMVQKENKILKIISLVYGFAGIAYLWFYDLYFKPNPLYGNRADTASNVGRDHWGAFIFWGIAIAGALVLNTFYAMHKFGVKNKFPKVTAALSLLGMTGVVLCKNEKLKRLSFTLNFETYTAPTYTSDYPEQTLATQKTLINSFLSMKSLHSAFSVTFGVLIAISIVTMAILLMKKNPKFKWFLIGFFVWICFCALYLKLFLGGRAELVVITLSILGMLGLFHSHLLEPKTNK